MVITIRKEKAMSEIKGQLLGIILTLSIFLTVGATLAGVFNTMSRSVENKVSEVVEFNPTNVSSQQQ